MTFLAAAPAARGATLTRIPATPDPRVPVGPTAEGQAGDWLLTNDRIAVAIDAVENPHGFSASGGHVVDAARLGAEDRFAGLFPMFDDTFGREAVYTVVELVDDGSESGVARLRSSGHDSDVPELLLVTEYILEDGNPFLRIETTVTNSGTKPVAALFVGDAVQWGLATHFLPGQRNEGRSIPGDGFDVGGRAVRSVEWIGSSSSGVSYGLASPGGLRNVVNGSSWTDGDSAELALPAGGSGTAVRWLLIGDGSVSSISDIAYRLLGRPTGHLSGRVVEERSRRPVAGAEVVVTTGACLGSPGAESVTVAKSGTDGTYSLDLPPGTYRVLVRSVGRTDSECADVTIEEGAKSVLDRAVGRSAKLGFRVRDTSGRALPAKLTILHSPVGPKRSGPDLGDHLGLVGGNAVLSATGQGSVALPPGRYEIWISRGMEYEVEVRTVELRAGQTRRVDVRLRRSVDTTGWMSADLHVHGRGSADSGVSFETRAVQAACEGLDVVVTTDHDHISDMSGAIRSTGVSKFVASVIGNEVTTPHLGHFNAYPQTLRPELPRNGALEHRGLRPEQIFAGLRKDPLDPAVQVNHPRAPDNGYFEFLRVNPVTGTSPDAHYSTDFDAIEVINGKRTSDVRASKNDWYRLLNRGLRVTGVGNSDTHQVFSQEIGYPRTYLRVGVDRPGEVDGRKVADAVKAHAAVLTTGPFVETWVNGVPMGGDVRAAAGGEVAVRVRVQAPGWVSVDTLEIVANGETVLTFPVPPGQGGVRLDRTFPLTLPKDAWVAVEVRGGRCAIEPKTRVCTSEGCPGRLDPVYPPFEDEPLCPFAHTNPVFVDADGDGRFDPPGNPEVRPVAISSLRALDAEGRAIRAGELVTVRGTVTLGSKTLSTFSNRLYITDGSSDAAAGLSGGICVMQDGIIAPTVTPGDVIEATGRVHQWDGELQVLDPSIVVLGRGDAPTPVDVSAADLADPVLAERWEGMLVRVRGVRFGPGWPDRSKSATVKATAPGGAVVDVRIDSATDLDGTPPPTVPTDVVGVVSQAASRPPYSGHHRLVPRGSGDLRPAAEPKP